MEQMYSVLMPLWQGENIKFLKESLKSMLTQTIPPWEVVFVIDAEIPEKMITMVEKLCRNRTRIQFVTAYELAGKGLGALLAKGVENCRCELIARMDSDDISDPFRCEKEINILLKYPRTAVVGSWLIEFEREVDKAQQIRNVPEHNREIMEFAKYRNPMNHSTVMFRKKAVLSAGNYSSKYAYCEDYELWYRMLKQGYIFYNIQEGLLFYRIGNGFLERRSRAGNLEAYVALKRTMKEDGFISSGQYWYSIAIQYMFAFAPVKMKKIIYGFLRKRL